MLAFGSYTLQQNPLALMQGRRRVSLAPRHLAVLELIVRAQGKPVDRTTFINQVWHGAFVEEANLTQTVFLLRRTLGKLPNGADYIETLPRRGYRLSARALDPPAAQLAPAAPFVEPDQQFRLLVESIEDYAIYMMDPGGRILTWNTGAEKNKGYTAQEVIGQHFSLFFLPEEIEARVPERELATAARTGRCVGEGWRIRKNGERFWINYVITAMRGPTGRLLGYSKVVRDLTERKRQEDAMLRMEATLRRERDRLRAAAESSMDALYICEAVRDTNGEIEDFIFTYLNHNVEKMVSIPREVMLRGRMCELMPVNRTIGLFDQYKKVCLTGEPYIAEFPVNADNITSEWIRVQAVRLEDGIAVTASDITRLKRAELATPHPAA